MPCKPFHHVAHCTRPGLIVKRPHDAARLETGHDASLGHIPHDVVVGQVGIFTDFCREVLAHLVELRDDIATLAESEGCHTTVKLLIEAVVEAADLRYPRVAFLAAWLIGESYSAQRAVQQIILQELPDVRRVR